MPKKIDWATEDEVKRWLREHDKSLYMKESPSIEFCAKLMRADGVVCSPELLRNSSSFMAIWRSVHEHREMEATA